MRRTNAMFVAMLCQDLKHCVVKCFAPVALVALVAKATAAVPAIAIPSTTVTTTVASSVTATATAFVATVIILGTLAGKVTDVIAPANNLFR